MAEERVTLFAEILLPLPIPGAYTYRIPFELNEKVHVGQRAVVQFGKTKIMSGLIVSLSDNVPDCTNIKYIIDVLDDDPVVNENQLKLWNWISSYYICYMGICVYIFQYIHTCKLIVSKICYGNRQGIVYPIFSVSLK